MRFVYSASERTVEFLLTISIDFRTESIELIIVILF